MYFTPPLFRISCIHLLAWPHTPAGYLLGYSTFRLFLSSSSSSTIRMRFSCSYIYMLYVYMFMCFKRVDVSMVVICYASNVVRYDRGTLELFDAPLHMKQDITSIDK